MELDTSKRTFWVKFVCITFPVACLLVLGILTVFLVIHTWIPVMVSGVLVLCGWLATILLRLTFVKIKTDGSAFKVLYHPVRILSGNYKKIEIRADRLAGSEIRPSLWGLSRELVLHENTPRGIASYPPVSLLLFNRANRQIIAELFKAEIR